MAISSELKSAIIGMNAKEKDKLLLRLVGKDNNLVERLQFELLEEGGTVDERRQDIKMAILQVAQRYHATPGWMMMDMRDLNARITQHVKITKDKYGDIELTLCLLNAFFEHQPKHLEVFNSRSETVSEYIAKRTESVLKKLEKFDEDYRIDFQADVDKLLFSVHTYCPRPYARQLGIPINWP